MPPTDEMIDQAVDLLAQVTLVSFTAEPRTILPLNTVTLAWKVERLTGPAARFVKLKLKGITVPFEGTMQVAPVRPATYELVAQAFDARTTLGSVSIEVELTGCAVNSVEEHVLLDRVRATLEQKFPHEDGTAIELPGPLPDLTVRVDNDRTRVLVDTGGMTVSGELDVEINNFPDGTVTFEAVFGLGAEQGQPVHRIIRFASDFDFPDTGDLLSLGLLKLADKVIDAVADDRIRKDVDDGIGETLRGLLSLLPSGCALVSVSPARRRVDFTLCPQRPGVDCAASLGLLVKGEDGGKRPY